ncbi:hypothetical protein LJB42_000425 [Komagataella kurtzmanii]|nr:hypothetical protein LJB42_000425 [Komagataella kurtzmanii]
MSKRKLTGEYSTDSDKNREVIAIEALNQLRNNGSTSPSVGVEQDLDSAQLPPMGKADSTTTKLIDKVTSYPIISTGINYMWQRNLVIAGNYIKGESSEKEVVTTKRQKTTTNDSKPEERSTPSYIRDNSRLRHLQDLKDIGMINFNLESRQKLQMLINFLKLGNRQLNQRIEKLIVELRRQQRGDGDDDTETETIVPDAPSGKDSESNRSRSSSITSVQTVYEDATSTGLASPNLNQVNHKLDQHFNNQPLNQVKNDIVTTVKRIVNVVSKFSGSALPEPARSNVREVLLKLPDNWANSVLPLVEGEGAGDSPATANTTERSLLSDPNGRVLVLAQESLDMVTKVIKFCSDTLDRADQWNLNKQIEQKTHLIHKLERINKHKPGEKQE